MDNGNYYDEDEVYVISSLTNNVAPKVSITSLQNNQAFIEGEVIPVSALASDLNDTVVRVEFYVDNNKTSTQD